MVAQTVKNLPAVQETGVRSLGQEDPLEKGMETHSSVLAWEIHGQRNLPGYSPWGCTESDTTENIHIDAAPLDQGPPPLNSGCLFSSRAVF